MHASSVDCTIKWGHRRTNLVGCPQKSPLNGQAATGRQWTSIDLEKPILVEIPSDFSRFSHRSGRFLDVLERPWMVGRGRFGLFLRFLCE